MRSPRALVIGNNCLDQVFHMDRPLQHDVKMTAGSMRCFGGGQGANVAYTLAGFGMCVSYLGAFGDDAAAGTVRGSLEGPRLSLDHCLVIRDCPTHVAVVLVNVHSGERSIVMYKDERLRLRADVVDDRLFDAVDLLYLDNHEPEASMAAAVAARRRGIPVLADLEQLDGVTGRMLPHVTSLIAPAKIVRELAGGVPLENALREVQRRGPRTVVATAGADGAVGVHADLPIERVPAAACRVVDTTGAGDAFHAGFAAAALSGRDFRESLRFAARVAAAKCEVMGPRLEAATLALWRDEVRVTSGPTAPSPLL